VILVAPPWDERAGGSRLLDISSSDELRFPCRLVLDMRSDVTKACGKAIDPDARWLNEMRIEIDDLGNHVCTPYIMKYYSMRTGADQAPRL
jgi:hypothetical protein